MDWKEQHGEVIKNFLQFLNKETDKYILKGGTALAQCYGLDRFSEDIDLDGRGNLIIDICTKFCNKNGYEYRIAKNTDTVKRCMVHYGGVKPLKIEMSSRRQIIIQDEITTIHGIKTYTIDVMAILKASAYQQRDKIRDLFDITFIINHYFDELTPSSKLVLQNALEYKGLDHFDYITHNQQDELIDVDLLAENFLNACEKAGLLFDNQEYLANELLNNQQKDEYKQEEFQEER